MLISVGSLTTRGKCNEIKKKEKWLDTNHMLKIFIIPHLFTFYGVCCHHQREKKGLRDKSTSRKMSQFILVS